jgi:hypothetical protein
MYRNIAGQKIALFAYDSATNLPKTGDAANLTFYVAKDGGSVTALADTSAAEKDATNAPGWYECDVSAAESNAHALLFSGKSSTSGIVVIGVVIYTDASVIAAGTAQAGSSSTIQLASATSFPDDIVIGAVVRIIGGTGINQARGIADWVSSTDTATVAPNWTTAPDNTSIYEVYWGAPVDVPTAAAIVAAVFAKTATKWNSLTFEELLTVVGAVVAGKVSGMGSNAPVFRALNDGSNVVSATTDSSGNRSAVTVTP